MLSRVPNPPGRRPHWLVVASCFLLAVGATVTATARESAPAAPAAAGQADAIPTVSPTSSSAATSSAAAHAGASSSATSAAPAGTRLDFGIDYSDTLAFASTKALDAGLDDAVHMGAQYIRVDFAWEDYQSTSAAFAPDFSRFDRVVAAANARGLKVLATIGFPPIWARESKCRSSAACPPASDSQFAEFAAEAAAHFAPQGVHDWEIWNEPNIPSWDPAPDPAAYAKLLSATAKSLHSADRGAYVIMGGLAAEQPHPGIPYVAAADFITAVGKAGGLADIQAVAYHPYPGQPNAALSPAIQAIDASPDNIVEALSKAGHPAMPVWITETGSSVPAFLLAHPSADEVASQESDQAQTAVSLVDVLSHTPNVAAMFWFNDQDQLSTKLVYGLRTSTGTVRPVLSALGRAIAADRSN